ncbi:MAG: thioredoxin-dependent thiol peroxidase [Acidobacteria bacterium]|nr:thioredoxin-dependent thiol peroxidase [Acidobacteriota bacterium]
MANHLLETGEKAPGFLLMNAEEEPVQLEDFSGKWLVLYFYPKDNTPGCTMEALDFTALKESFATAGSVIVGVSPDSCAKHRNFIGKKKLTIELLSDSEHQVLEAYGVWQLKKNYGREYYGVVRTTFLIDPEGKIEKIWPKVRVKGHAEAVLAALYESKDRK